MCCTCGLLKSGRVFSKVVKYRCVVRNSLLKSRRVIC